jgi:hypothetical protein
VVPIARDVPVLITGDAEADLGRVALADNAPTRVARGIAAGCAALRSTEFGAVVVDVAAGDDALAILRAAGRGRPQPRVVCLLAADFNGELEVARLIARTAFAVRRHPLHGGEIDRLVADALADFQADGDASRGGALAQSRWTETEYQLADALRSIVTTLAGGRPGAETEDLIARCIAAASDAARDGMDGATILSTLAGALDVEVGAMLGGTSGTEREAAA